MAVQGPWVLTLVQAWLTGKTIKAMLLDAAHTEDIDDDNVSDLTELVATGYTAGGQTLTGVVASYDSTDNVVKIDCDDIVFGAVDSTSIAGVAFYDSATGVLMATDVFDAPVDTTGSGFTYLVSDDGIVVLAPTPVA